MSRQKSLQSLGILAVAISPALIIFSGLPPQLLAQSSSMKISLEFPPTDDRGAPGITAGEECAGGRVARLLVCGRGRNLSDAFDAYTQ